MVLTYSCVARNFHNYNPSKRDTNPNFGNVDFCEFVMHFPQSYNVPVRFPSIACLMLNSQANNNMGLRSTTKEIGTA